MQRQAAGDNFPCDQLLLNFVVHGQLTHATHCSTRDGRCRSPPQFQHTVGANNIFKSTEHSVVPPQCRVGRRVCLQPNFHHVKGIGNKTGTTSRNAACQDLFPHGGVSVAVDTECFLDWFVGTVPSSAVDCLPPQRSTKTLPKS